MIILVLFIGEKIYIKTVKEVCPIKDIPLIFCLGSVCSGTHFDLPFINCLAGQQTTTRIYVRAFSTFPNIFAITTDGDSYNRKYTRIQK